MYLLNLGYQWSNHDIVEGVIINASGVHIQQANRRDQIEAAKWKLFDPQFYLKTLDLDQSRKTCERLSTYPWFGGSSVDFNSGEYTPTAWFQQHKKNVQWDNNIPSDEEQITKCIKDCLNFQISIGVTHLIAPIPIIGNPEDEFAQQLKWIDVVENLQSDYDKPILITIAFLDNLFFYEAPLENKLFQTMLDNLSVRTELDGIYVVPIQTNDSTLKIDDKYVVESLLHLCNFMAQNEKVVVTNFVDSLGFACLGAGATAFGGGYSNKEKRMCLNDFIDASGGRSYPRFYSFNLISDLYSNRDLNKVKDVRLIRLIKDDITDVSTDLYSELKNGGSANNVPNWRESLNNVTTSKQHRIKCFKEKTNLLNNIEQIEKKEESVLEWLQNANANKLLLDSKLIDNPLSDDSNHISLWLSAFEEYLDNK